MKRFAAFANAGASHQMAMCAIGRELKNRGHEFLLLGTQYQARQLRAQDVCFEVIGREREDPVLRYFERAKEAEDLPISATIEYMKSMADLLCAELPSALTRQRIDFVLADQEEPGAAAAAEIAQLPYASICNSLPLNEAPDIPPGFLTWRYSPAFFATVRNRFGYAVRNFAVRGVQEVLNRYRRAANLAPWRTPDDSFSKTAQISQLVQAFDFPRKSPLPNFHYVGPFQREPLQPVAFPWELLNGLPLIYASFGTSFGGRTADLRTVAEVCSELPVQLVLSLGGARFASEHDAFPASAIVVAYAPQQELLARSALAVTHAGLNTTLEALSVGVPLLAMPIAGDQFGVSSRLSRQCAGHVLYPGQRSPDRVREAIRSLLEDPQWKKAAERLRDAIRHSGGAAEAAAIVEHVAG